MFKIKVEDNSPAISYLFLDKKDYLLKVQKDVSYASGQETVSITYFKAHKDFSGILYPTKIESKMNGQTLLKISIGDVLFDKEYPESFFSKPG